MWETALSKTAGSRRAKVRGCSANRSMTEAGTSTESQSLKVSLLPRSQRRTPQEKKPPGWGQVSRSRAIIPPQNRLRWPRRSSNRALAGRSTRRCVRQRLSLSPRHLAAMQSC